MPNKKSDWTSLEIAKFASSLLLPAVGGLLTYEINISQKHADARAALLADQQKRRDAEEERQRERHDLAVSTEAERQFARQLQNSDTKSRQELQINQEEWQDSNHRLDLQHAELDRQSDQHRQDIAERIKDEDEKQQSVAEISRLIFERRTRSVLLISSLRRFQQNPNSFDRDELKNRKRDYDESYVSWNTNILNTMFRVRRVLHNTGEFSDEQSIYYQNVIQDRPSKRMFGLMDKCITKSYDITFAGKNGVSVMDKCNIDGLIHDTQICGYNISDVLFNISIGEIDFNEDKRDLDGNCPVDDPSNYPID